MDICTKSIVDTYFFFLHLINLIIHSGYIRACYSTQTYDYDYNNDYCWSGQDRTWLLLIGPGQAIRLHDDSYRLYEYSCRSYEYSSQTYDIQL